MKLDKEKVNSIVSLPDEEMWRQISELARSYGFELPKKTPPHGELEKIRALASSNRVSLADAMKLMNTLKRSGKNG